MNYHGLFSAEFKKDNRTGVWKLLEINPRTSAWFSTFSQRCGINIKLTSYADAIGADVEYSGDYATGFKWICPDNFRAAVKMMRNGDLEVGEYLSSLQGVREYMRYAQDDVKPFLIGLKDAIAWFKKHA